MDGRKTARLGPHAAAGFDGGTRIALAAGETTGDRSPVKPDSLVLRKCKGLDELRACVLLQKEVWNFTDIELVPLRIFVVAEKVGGQVMGAFEGKDLIGF